MAFLSKIGNILRQNAAKHSVSDLQFSNLSIYQVVRFMSSMSSSKIFIGGLSFSTDDQSLREVFTKYGEVIEARVIVDRETGRSRGFGFVTFTSGEAATSAIQALDGQDLHGRRVRVNYANERTQGGGGYGGGGYGGGGYGGGGYGGGGYGGGGYGGGGYGGGGYGGGYGGGGSYGGDSGGYAGSGGSGGGSGGYGGGSGNYGSGGYSGTGYGSGSGGNYTGNYGGSDNQSGGGNYGGNSYGSGATSGGYGGNQFSSGAASGNTNSMDGNYNVAGGVGGPENFVGGHGGFGGNGQVGEGGSNQFGEQTQDEPLNLNERDDEDDEFAKRG